MDDHSNLRILRAKYNFKGKNNDELCFKKGDFIVLTQAIDSDWWEGTLDEKTGWFPVSYVQEIRYDQIPDEQKQKYFGSQIKTGSQPATSTARSYHTEVLANVIETETSFLTEAEQSWSNLIQPLGNSNILSKEEFSLVASNYEEIIALHRQFLVAMKECTKQALNVRRVGRIFMEQAPAFRIVYERYASNHPRAVRILHAQKTRNAAVPINLSRFIAERTGSAGNNLQSASPQDIQALLPLTTALALPLCHLEKCPLTLRELERHLDEGHFDRGDTQRALSLFKSLIADCQELRLLRELELDLANANIANLPTSLEAPGAENIHKLANGVVFLSPVKLATGTDVVDRLFVLYPTKLVILSAEPDLTQLAFEAEFPLTQLYVDRALPNPEIAKRFLHSFSLFFKPVVPLAVAEECLSHRGSQSDCFVVVCSSHSLSSRWIDLLSSVCTSESSLSAKSSGQVSSNEDNAQRKIEVSTQLISKRRSASLNTFPIQQRQQLHLSPISCVVSNAPQQHHQPISMSSNLAALAPASPHPSRKGATIIHGNAIQAAAMSAVNVATASTPLARKKFAAGTSFVGPPITLSSQSSLSQDSNFEDQQLIAIVESFVSTPQMVSIERAQSNISPSGSDHRLNGHHTLSHSHLIPLSGVNPSCESVVINQALRVQSAANTSRNSASIRPDLLIPEEEKLLLEELKPLHETGSSGGGGLQERTLVDAVYTLWDYVAELRGEVARLRQASQTVQ